MIQFQSKNDKSTIIVDINILFSTFANLCQIAFLLDQKTEDLRP